MVSYFKVQNAFVQLWLHACAVSSSVGAQFSAVPFSARTQVSAVKVAYHELLQKIIGQKIKEKT